MSAGRTSVDDWNASSALHPSSQPSRRSRSAEGKPVDDDDDVLFNPVTAAPNKFDPNDHNLEGLLENNRRWATAVQNQRPQFFHDIAQKQEPKVLWIGCSDSRVPANQVVQLGPGEVFVHRNIANVVVNTDLNCLSVLQYAVEHLEVEHVIVCGHYKCGGVAAAMTNTKFGLLDSWLRSIKDVYRRHVKELTAIENRETREKRLVELNVENSAFTVAHSTIVQDAWAKGKKLRIHSWVYDLETGIVNDLPLRIENRRHLDDIYTYDQ